jgi:transcriptional regulator
LKTGEVFAVYVPQAFANNKLSDLHEFVEKNSFATLVTNHLNDRLVASHIPLLLVRDCSKYGTLLGHIARGNDQWREVKGETLAIFSGPHAYVSPRWYEADQVVPTWNYVAVHAYGILEIISDRTEFLGLLRRMVDTFEDGAENPWTLERSGDAVDKLLTGIVGFRIPISRIEGKWKLSQNHPIERQAKVIAALESELGEDALEIAALMRKNLESS